MPWPWAFFAATYSAVCAGKWSREQGVAHSAASRLRFRPCVECRSGPGRRPSWALGVDQLFTSVRRLRTCPPPCVPWQSATLGLAQFTAAVDKLCWFCWLAIPSGRR